MFEMDQRTKKLFKVMILHLYPSYLQEVLEVNRFHLSTLINLNH